VRTRHTLRAAISRGQAFQNLDRKTERPSLARQVALVRAPRLPAVAFLDGAERFTAVRLRDAAAFLVGEGRFAAGFLGFVGDAFALAGFLAERGVAARASAGRFLATRPFATRAVAAPALVARSRVARSLTAGAALLAMRARPAPALFATGAALCAAGAALSVFAAGFLFAAWFLADAVWPAAPAAAAVLRPLLTVAADGVLAFAAGALV
jgi:hypothetical protein